MIRKLEHTYFVGRLEDGPQIGSHYFEKYTRILLYVCTTSKFRD